MALHTSSTSDYNWQLPSPFVSEWRIEQEHIDHYKHTNNVAYLSRLERLAWEHSESLGLDFKSYEEQNRAMAIVEHHLSYHLPSHLHDLLYCATWIVACDNKFRLSRAFQFINAKTKKTVFSAKTNFVCIQLSNGSPKRIPKLFADIYGAALIQNQELAAGKV